MRYWSRILALLLAVLLCIPLFSCTGDKLIAQPEKTTEGVLNWAGRGKEEQKTTPEPEGYPITFGLSTGVAYTSRSYMNPYFGLRIDLDHDWMIDSTFEIDEANDLPTNLSQNSRKEKYIDLLDTGAAVSDFYAESDSGLQGISITVVYWDEENNTGEKGAAYCEKYAQALRGDTEQGVIKLNEGKVEQAYIAGESWPCLYYTIENDAAKTYCATVFLQRGNYILILAVDSLVTDHTEELLDRMEPLK